MCTPVVDGFARALLVYSSPSAQQINGLLGNHHRRRVGIAAHDARHDRCVHHAQAREAVHAQLRIHHIHRPGPHAATAHRVVDGVSILANELLDLRIGAGAGRRRHFPREQLPPVVRAISDWLPLTNAVELVRPLFMDQWPDNVMRHGLVLVVTTVAAFWVALALTRKRFKA